MKTENIYVQILRSARLLIGVRTRFVCIAISCAARDAGYPYDTTGPAERLRDWISTSLGGDYAVNAWLLDQGIALELLTPDNLKAYRLNWIDSMIEQVKTWTEPCCSPS